MSDADLAQLKAELMQNLSQAIQNVSNEEVMRRAERQRQEYESKRKDQNQCSVWMERVVNCVYVLRALKISAASSCFLIVCFVLFLLARMSPPSSCESGCSFFFHVQLGLWPPVLLRLCRQGGRMPSLPQARHRARAPVWPHFELNRLNKLMA